MFSRIADFILRQVYNLKKSNQATFWTKNKKNLNRNSNEEIKPQVSDFHHYLQGLSQ